eukprot:10640555-Alexandrium_andersonii.AAC.1
MGTSHPPAFSLYIQWEMPMPNSRFTPLPTRLYGREGRPRGKLHQETGRGGAAISNSYTNRTRAIRTWT